MSTIFAYQMTPGDRVNVGNEWVTVLEVTRCDGEWVSNGVVRFRATNGYRYGVDRYHDVTRPVVESEEDYALACDAMYAADPSNRCQHDNGVEDIEGVEVCEMCGETVEEHA